uniref:Uncharacterized protein n=1 Tax=Rhizophora mucronata TaxID=61149 RepID=A0A2P2NVG2_RHIMU
MFTLAFRNRICLRVRQDTRLAS